MKTLKVQFLKLFLIYLRHIEIFYTFKIKVKFVTDY